MISRTWHGLVPNQHAQGFSEYLKQTGVKEAVALKGNLAAYVEQIVQDGYTHFFLCTIWQSWEDIKEYAGEQPQIAITYPEDEKYGLLSDPIVIHQEVSNCNNPFKQ